MDTGGGAHGNICMGGGAAVTFLLSSQGVYTEVSGGSS